MPPGVPQFGVSTASTRSSRRGPNRFTHSRDFLFAGRGETRRNHEQGAELLLDAITLQTRLSRRQTQGALDLAERPALEPVQAEHQEASGMDRRLELQERRPDLLPCLVGVARAS